MYLSVALKVDITCWILSKTDYVKVLRSRQNGHLFADDIFKCIFFTEDVSISSKISLKFVPKGPIDNILALVQKTMCWYPQQKDVRIFCYSYTNGFLNIYMQVATIAIYVL